MNELQKPILRRHNHYEICNRATQFEVVQKEGFNLFIMKNADYGDAFASHGVVGVMMRIHDKLNRYENITKTKIELINDESLRDTLLDLHNYAAMAIMLYDEKNNII